MTQWGGRTVRRSRVGVTAMLAATGLLMTGCTAVGTIGAGPASLTPGAALSAAADAGAQPADSVPVAEADSETAAAVRDALNALAGQSGRPGTEQVLGALESAGFTGPGVEVTLTSTPTGLEADAVEAAVLDGGDCIMGHIREGNVTVTVLPVLASGRCFIGSVVQ